MRTPTRAQLAASATFLLAILSIPAPQAQNAPPVDPKTISVIDAGIGPCSADFTVNDANGAPVYDAKIRVHIGYGLMSLHKLDLEVGTNAAGKARFTGIPEKTRQGLFFRAAQGDREGSAFDNPAKTCNANLTITLDKK
jgi:hypothetical protein